MSVDITASVSGVSIDTVSGVSIDTTANVSGVSVDTDWYSKCLWCEHRHYSKRLV